MTPKRDKQINEIVKTLSRLRDTIQSNPQEQHIQEYAREIDKYESMRNGGDGGLFRQTTSTVRELHFNGWKDSDFQLLLERLGEVPILSDDEWQEKFSHESSFFGKLFGKKGRPA